MNKRYFIFIISLLLSLPSLAGIKSSLRVSIPQQRVHGATTAELAVTVETEKGEVAVGTILLKVDTDSMLVGELVTDVDEPHSAAALWTEDPHVGFSFFLEPGEISVVPTGQYDYNVSGTPLNDALCQYRKDVEGLERNARITEKTDSITEAYMRRYADTPLFGVLFSSHSSVIYSSFLDTKTEVERLWAIGGEKQKRVKTTLNTYKHICHNDIEDGMHYRDAEIGNATVEGGRSVRLSDFIGKGKWVLIDFWASWCVGCRQAIPRVKKAYEALKNSNIEFVSIAVWDKRPAALKAIKEENMPWRQLIDEKGVCGDTYMFNAIPRLMLFAPDGTLADKDVQSMNILQTLQQKMGEK